MSISIQTLEPLYQPICALSFFSEINEKASQVFFKAKECLFPLGQQEASNRAVIDLTAIWRDPGQLLEGGIWGAWWATSVCFLSSSLKELYSVAVEQAGDMRFEKITLAVKSVFVDLISLASSTLFTLCWADGAKIVALGQYLPLVRYLNYGASLFINIIETGFDMVQFYDEAKGLLNEQNQLLSDQHTKRVCHLSMKLISSVSMIAWALLGICSLAGAVVHSVLMPLLLTVGCVLGLGAIFYKMQIEEPMKRNDDGQ